MSRKQSELIRSLRLQIEAKDRELADQKWVFEQFLNSPSWRLTYPIRWLAKQLRVLRDHILGHSKNSEPMAASRPAPPEDTLADTGNIDSILELKQLFTDFYRMQLRLFLTSPEFLELPQSDSPEVSVILVLFNRAELTLACLRSILENHSERMEIIIVDNASQDETPFLLDRLRGARIIRNKENKNFLLAVNQASREACGEYLLLLNNDAQLLPGSLHAAQRTIRSASDIGAVGGRLILLDGSLQEAGSMIWRDGSCMGYGRGDNPFAPMYMFRRDVDYCSGAFLLTSRQAWNQLGGFDEAFKPAYYEETDYCTRLWENGLRVVYEPNAVLLHYEFASSQSVSHATDLQREHQRIFSTHHQASLATRYESDLNNVLSARMKDSRQKRVLFVDDQAPHTWLGSGFPRSRSILQALLQQNYFVTFYPLSLFEEEWASVYKDMPAEVEFMIGYGPSLLEAFLRTRRSYYDILFVSRPHNMKLLKPILEGHPEWFHDLNIIYDAEAIFATREITYRQMSGISISKDEFNALLKEEVELASAADCVVAVSEGDARQFRTQGIEDVEVIGHTLAADPTPRLFDEREGFLFVGAIHEEASPNGDSVIWFLEEIFPRIRATLGRDISFTIAGINKSERIAQLAQLGGPGIRITGHLADLTELYDSARVFVAPTRYAAGIPHKIHEAVSRGIPVVATPLLASQLAWTKDSPILIGADAESFALKCVQLYSDRRLWEALRDAGLARITTECSDETFQQCVAAATARSDKKCWSGGAAG